jgi:hypothetical protein
MSPDDPAAYMTMVRRAAVGLRVLVAIIAIGVLTYSLATLTDPTWVELHQLVPPRVRMAVALLMSLLIGLGSVIWSIEYALGDRDRQLPAARTMLLAGLVCFAFSLPMILLLSLTV